MGFFNLRWVYDYTWNVTLYSMCRSKERGFYEKWNAIRSWKYLMAAVMVLGPYPSPYHRDRFSSVGGSYFLAMTRCCVGVWFAYMAMEGFIHTRNLKTTSSASGLGR